jgi:hypothetical protein
MWVPLEGEIAHFNLSYETKFLALVRDRRSGRRPNNCPTSKARTFPARIQPPSTLPQPSNTKPRHATAPSGSFLALLRYSASSAPVHASIAPVTRSWSIAGFDGLNPDIGLRLRAVSDIVRP